MSCSTLLRQVESLRNRCVKRGLPDWLQQYVEAKMAYARRCWEVSRDKTAPESVRHDRLVMAQTILLSLLDLLFTYRRHTANARSSNEID